ncbi:MAG: PDDEXK nuclease domain-containing protein [Bacteroidales bacterium]
MNFEQLIQVFEQAHNYLQESAVSAVNQSLTIRNWLFGHYIVEYEQNGEDRAKYGDKLLATLAKDLKSKGIKGLSQRNLYNFCQFYLTYPDISQLVANTELPKAILQTLSAKSEIVKQENENIGVAPQLLISRLSFSHIIELIGEKDPTKRAFYEIESIKGNWSIRELKRQMGSLMYERTGLSKYKKGLLTKTGAKARRLKPEEVIRDPYVFEFLGLPPRDEVSEDDLETALLDHLQAFLMEMGRGFCFEARQKRITVDNEHFYIDLVFYHRILRCHVLIDLKIRKFKHTDAGQMNFYLNYYLDNEMEEGDELPIGILLCTEKDESTARYALGNLDNKVFVSRYKVALPTEEELQKLIEEGKRLLGQ